MLKIILSDRGAMVRCAFSADEALSLLGDQRPDVVISDIGMPGKDGYDLIREIRDQESSLPKVANGCSRISAIALTSFSREQDRELALKRGFDAHCAKPLRPLNLVQQILSIVMSNAAKRTEAL